MIYADFHPAYGKSVEIDHGNGLVTRYAHGSELLVRRATWSSAAGVISRSDRPAAPPAALHFEVRLNGIPQNRPLPRRPQSHPAGGARMRASAKSLVSPAAAVRGFCPMPSQRASSSAVRTPGASSHHDRQISKTIFGSRNDRLLKQYRGQVHKINAPKTA